MFTEQITEWRNSKNKIKELEQIIKETNYYWIYRWIENNLPSYIPSFEDSVSQGQYDSKKWLCDELKKINLKSFYPLHIDIVGSWFGFPLIEMISKIFKIKQIDLYDLDVNCHRVTSQYVNHFDFDFRIIQFGDFFDRKQLKRRHVIINTSSEHMKDIVHMKKYYKDYPITPLLVLQSNNYRNVEDHVNCVNNEKELIDKNEIREVYFSGKLTQPLYDRFMVIGRW